MSNKDVNPFWNFVPYVLYWLTTSLHEAPVIKLWCPEKKKGKRSRQSMVKLLEGVKHKRDRTGNRLLDLVHVMSAWGAR